MAAFKNPKNFSVPTHEETLLLIETFKELDKKVNILEKKVEKLSDRKDKIEKKILVYNVNIRYFDEYRPFSSLNDAVKFKASLVSAGIKSDDINIELTDDWDIIEYIDGFKDPDEADHYDAETLYTCYRKWKKQSNKNWHDDD